MNRKIEQWPLLMLNRRRNVINTNPNFQRTFIWTKARQQLLIDSVLRDLDIPKIYLRQIASNPDKFEVVDGQQRISSLWDYYDNKFSLSSRAEPVDGYPVAGLRYEKLPAELQDKIDNYQLTCIILDLATDLEVRELFVRLQNGMPLTAAEIRHAKISNIRDLCVKLAKHRIFQHCGFHNRRYGYEHVAAQMLILELVGHITDVPNAVINKKYEEHKNLSFVQGEGKRVERRVVQTLDFLAAAFQEKTPELKAYILVSLFYLVSTLLKYYVVRNMEPAFYNWFLDFSRRRRADEELRVEDRDPELIAFQRGAELQMSLRLRHDVLSRDFFLHFPDLPTLDQQRDFRHEQRLAIYRRDQGLCQWVCTNGEICGQKLTWDNWHADHVQPWAEGGPTLVSNGRVLCAPRNLQSGNGNPIDTDTCPFTSVNAQQS